MAFTTVQAAIDALGRPILDFETDGEHTASAQIVTGAALFGGCVLSTDGAGNVTAQCFKGEDDTGDTLCPPITILAGDRDPAGILFPWAVDAPTGIYLKVTGTGGSVNVFQKPRFVPA
jgi:hypothetical protein